MKDRVLTGLLLTLAIIMCLVLQFFTPYFFDCVILLISVLAVIEFTQIQDKAGKPAYKYVGIIVACILFLDVIISVALGGNALIVFMVAVAVLLLTYLGTYFANAWFRKNKLEAEPFRQVTNMSVAEYNFFKTNNTFAGFFYPVFILFFMYLVNHIDTLGFTNITENFAETKIALFGLVLIFAISSLTDTFAMAIGCWLGKHKLCPKISPKKSVEGALAGLLGGILGALIPFFIFSAIYAEVEAFAAIQFWQLMLIGLFGSVVCQAGDLFESYLKRKANVKDAGTILRSHGGVLDRLDSIIFCTPYIFICLLLLIA